MNIPTLGFWFFRELAPLMGMGAPSLQLETPNYGTFRIKVSSARVECLLRNNRCVQCGKVGVVWLLQAHHCSRDKDNNIILRETPHLNLFAVHGDELILMTKDHIIPRSKGGWNTLDNYQSMCAPCNHLKGNTL